MLDAKIEAHARYSHAPLYQSHTPDCLYDHLLLVRTGGQWRISAAAWGNPVPPP
ncbi:nuclear transport factor 2 family protein [Corallococcus interemptor]|uniref:hypothetical protein n=1 Tax=Corallococcus interemptor TaxID=2316720 RepID=UPI0035D4DDC3